MPRQRRTHVEPRLRNLPGRRKLYIEWTPIGEQGCQRRSTGVEGDAGNPPAEALEALEAFKAALERPSTDTVQDLMDARLRDAEGRVSPVTLRNMRQQHKNLCARLGHLDPADLTRARIKRYIERERAGCQDIKKGFAAAAEAAGVPWCTPHHLKHTAISWLFDAGYSLDWVAKFTETTPAVCERIYRKTNPDAYADMAESLGDRVFGQGVTVNERSETG
jgi:hypothetical protein